MINTVGMSEITVRVLACIDHGCTRAQGQRPLRVAVMELATNLPVCVLSKLLALSRSELLLHDLQHLHLPSMRGCWRTLIFSSLLADLLGQGD